MLGKFFYEGGFGMYPTVIFGFILVLSALLLAIRPERRFLPLIYSLSVVTFGSGLLGVSMGLINTFRYAAKIPPAEQMKVIAIGCAESLHNIVLALIIVVFSCLLAAVAGLRGLRSSPRAEG